MFSDVFSILNYFQYFQYFRWNNYVFRFFTGYVHRAENLSWIDLQPKGIARLRRKSWSRLDRLALAFQMRDFQMTVVIPFQEITNSVAIGKLEHM